ncbi:MAG: hypothetical protein OXC00_14885 [Acidimicrobiaceae bacterium]|nr:hypothetical protein [Acidimicrobiaceae bacterium]
MGQVDLVNHGSIATNVQDGRGWGGSEHRSRHEQPPMALAGILFTAHHGDPLLACDIAQACESLAEARRRGEGTVEDMTLGVIQLGLERATSELATEEQVAQPDIG